MEKIISQKHIIESSEDGITLKTLTVTEMMAFWTVDGPHFSNRVIARRQGGGSSKKPDITELACKVLPGGGRVGAELQWLIEAAGWRHLSPNQVCYALYQ